MTDLTQTAPFPVALAELVSELRYKTGWTFTLEHLDRGQGSVGLTLCILIYTPDAYHPEEFRLVMHYFIVPAAAYDRQSWQRWLLDRVLDVETHEACEFFQLVKTGDFVLKDGSRSDEHVKRPYAPNHGPGRDPYVIFDYASDEQRRTSFRGEVGS
jgi:hypothetical protein